METHEIEVALAAADAGNAGHWPTVAAVLADAYRAELKANTTKRWCHYVNLARRFRNMEIHLRAMMDDAEHNVKYWDLPEVADLKKFHEGKLSACEEILQWIRLALASESQGEADAPADGKPDCQEENAKAMTPGDTEKPMP